MTLDQQIQAVIDVNRTDDDYPLCGQTTALCLAQLQDWAGQARELRDPPE